MSRKDRAGSRNPDRILLRDKLGLPGSAILLLIPLILGLLIYLVIVVFGSPVRINGDSMYPALDHGDRVLLMKYYFGGKPSRGDIVSLKDVTGESGENMIKRVVAVGGDVITCQGDFLVVNGETAYLNVIRVGETHSETVPGNYIYVIGDNEAVSYDSRHFGPVPLEKIDGRAVFVFWPPENLKKL